MTYTDLLTYVSLPLNIQLKFAGGTESAMQSSVTLWPGGAADGPIIDVLYGPTAQRAKFSTNTVHTIVILKLTFVLTYFVFAVNNTHS